MVHRDQGTARASRRRSGQGHLLVGGAAPNSRGGWTWPRSLSISRKLSKRPKQRRVGMPSAALQPRRRSARRSTRPNPRSRSFLTLGRPSTTAHVVACFGVIRSASSSALNPAHSDRRRGTRSPTSWVLDVTTPDTWLGCLQQDAERPTVCAVIGARLAWKRFPRGRFRMAVIGGVALGAYGSPRSPRILACSHCAGVLCGVATHTRRH